MKNQLEDHKALFRRDDEFTIYSTLRNKLGLDHAAVCGIMANIGFESDFCSTMLQISCAAEFGCSGSEYTEGVDTGRISQDDFVHDGAGYGLCQWTLYTRKEKLYRFLKDRDLSIGDLQGQVDFLIHEMETDFPYVLVVLRNTREGHPIIIKNKPYVTETHDTLQRAYDVAYFFCELFEEPDEKVLYDQCRKRARFAKILYVQYSGSFFRKNLHGVRKSSLVSEDIGDIYQKTIISSDYTFMDEISPCMINTVISLEDINFRRHKGIDYLKTIRALLRSVTLKRRFGGSTITQQLAKNLYLSSEKTLRRKLREMLLARYIEKNLSKDQILELYLNVIYYGHGAYGIRNASRAYFGCEPSELELYQCVALCAVLPAPSRFNPFADKELFLKRADLALRVLAKHKDLDRNEIAEIQKAEKDFVGRIEERMAWADKEKQKIYRKQLMQKELSGWNNYRGKLEQCMEHGGDTTETFQKYRVEYNESLKKKMRLCSYPSSTGEKFQFHHLFFHSLILEPEKAFNHVAEDTDFESWFVTLDEFKKIIHSLYERGYVLVNMRALLSGQIQLPKGKTPLVLSFDDMNYYDYMKECGFVSRMILDAQGGISYIKEDDGCSVEIKYGDSVTVLEDFIAGHPDFSYGGARGIIGLTGYEGLFGYRDLTDPQLSEVVQKLKSMGWDMACHSFRHNSRIYNNGVPNAPEGIADVDKWLTGPGKILGKTDIFITPFGVDIRNNPQLLEYLKDQGFVYFCNVADRRSVETDGESFYIQRYSVDGVMMQNRRYDFEFYYGDLSSIGDTKRKTPLQSQGMDAGSLVRHAYTCMRMPTVYCRGGMGQILTREWLPEAKKRNPEHYRNSSDFDMLWSIPNGEIRCFDCSGLIKCYLMGGLRHFEYDRSLDINARTMLKRAEGKGTIETMPEQPGICVYMADHVGIYAGNGRVIEATPNPRFGNGVVMTRLTDREWSHWFRLSGISYET